MAQGDTASAIAWRDWNEDAFAAARAEGKPVLLTLGATWCHWCHVMDETSYSDSRVIELVNSRFIPVRVDVDQRPDISLRYNQGGYPSVAFLTADGEFLAGRPYTPPDEMAVLLQQVSSGEITAPDGSAADRPASPRRSGPGGASVDARTPANPPGFVPSNEVLERLSELYDQQFGGFGVEPKQPPWEALHFLVARYALTGDRSLLAMVENTLQGMWHGIYDRKDNGFFRYSVSRDWKVPHYEKMLVSNASLAMVYCEAYQVTGKRLYKTAVEGVAGYLLNTLYSSADGLFFASQDADEPYYQMSWKARDANPPPPIDRTFYAGWNALAAQALVKSGDTYSTGRILRDSPESGGNPSHTRLAQGVLEKLWRESWTSAEGLRRRAGGCGDSASVLIDQVYFLRAWLALYQSTGAADCLTRAVEVADTAQRLFG